MRTNSLLILIMCLLVSHACAENPASWRVLPAALSGQRISRIVLDPENSARIYLLTTNGLLMLTNAQAGGGIRVPELLLSDRVNDVLIREKGRVIWAATDQGLLVSRNHGKDWASVRQGEAALSLLEKNGKIFLGTQHGLFLIDEYKKMAMNLGGGVDRRPIRMLRQAPQGLLAVTDSAVYLIRPGQDVSEMILKISGDEESGEASDEEAPEDASPARKIRAVEVMEDAIYVVSTDGILRGQGHRVGWEKIASDGLLLGGVDSLSLLGTKTGAPVLCVSGSGGVQCHLEGAWVSVQRGLGSDDISSLVIDQRGNLFAGGGAIYMLSQVTREALLAMADMVPSSACDFKDYAQLREMFSHEPSVKDVQKMSVRYSDTDKAKIDAWHRQSRIRAFVPSVSAGVNRAATELYHWDTGPNPDALQKGREYHDWDVSVSWDLGDVIWSSNQTSIDSRSKLMAEFRGQVLDQVTRLYFERRRVQIELSACRYASQGERMAAEMRVDELTAHIDSYTGGEFSKKVNRKTNT